MTQEDKQVRVRFAPSPTGWLHIGGLRTALYSYLFARQTGGKFIVRIEDTDRTRLVEGAEEALFAALEWAGIAPDESIGVGGDFGPYRQSDRLEVYAQFAQKLLDSGHAYKCFCSSERLGEVRKQMQKDKVPPMYDGYCRDLSAEKIAQNIADGQKFVVRLRVPKGEEIVFDDIVRGRIKVKSAIVDDQVLMKSDCFPTYHLASVVDDHLMEITHVIRGEEWLPSAPKHILLYQAFGWELPQFAHIPLLLNPDRSKLSKRQGDVAVEDYRAKGFLPQALVNFVALLGWNPGKGETQEIFAMDELIARFSLDKVHKAGAVCDLERLRWFNAQHIKRLSVSELIAQIMPFLEKKEFYQKAEVKYQTAEHIRRIVTIEQERLQALDEIGKESHSFFFVRPQVSPELLIWKDATPEQTAQNLRKAYDVLGKVADADWTHENLTKILMTAAGNQRGEFLFPLRAALTGAKRSPSPIDCAWVLRKEETLTRIGKCM